MILALIEIMLPVAGTILPVLSDHTSDHRNDPSGRRKGTSGHRKISRIIKNRLRIHIGYGNLIGLDKNGVDE
jgi:hypothetical protein